jgi:type VI secretion system protein ImpE
VNGNYYWAPFSRIGAIKIEEPVDLRDMVWVPAEFTWSNDGQAVGLIPTRYVGTVESEDDALRLSRRTDWQEQHTDVFAGLGQRVLATDHNDYSLLDVREVLLNSSDRTDEGQTQDHG